MGMPRRSRYRPSLRSLWVAVALIACVWALPWLCWIKSVPRVASAPRRVHATPHVVYVRRTLGESAPWSPVVFALPTSWGFRWTGRTNLTEDIMAVAGLPAGALAAYLEPEAKNGIEAVGTWRLAAPDLSGLAGGPAAWAESDGQAFAAGAGASNGVRQAVVISPSLEMRGFNFKLPLSADFTNGVPPAWLTAQATVELDSAGTVTHVVLDSPSARSEWDQALVRALRTGQADPAEVATRGSVRAGVSGR